MIMYQVFKLLIWSPEIFFSQSNTFIPSLVITYNYRQYIHFVQIHSLNK